MKKIGASFLVLNLVVSMIAFGFIFNIGVVSGITCEEAGGEWLNAAGNSGGTSNCWKEGVDITDTVTTSDTTTDTTTDDGKTSGPQTTSEGSCPAGETRSDDGICRPIISPLEEYKIKTYIPPKGSSSTAEIPVKPKKLDPAGIAALAGTISGFKGLIPEGKAKIKSEIEAGTIDGVFPVDGGIESGTIGLKKVDNDVFAFDKGGNQIGEALLPEDLAKYGITELNGKFSQVGTGSKFGDIFLHDWGWGTGASNLFGHITSGVMWAGTVSGAIALIGGFVGDDELTNAASIAAFGGIMAGKSVYGLFKTGGYAEGAGETGTKFLNKLLPKKLEMGVKGWSTGIGIGVGAAIFYATYKKESTETVNFECLSWDAPTKGEDCEKCNDQIGDLPCSEYQCRSLGQACEMVNTETAEPKCIWKDKNDAAFPIITPWNDALIDETYKYTPDNAISPPDRGVMIIKTDSDTECVQAFTPMTFGIETDELAKCKIDYQRTETFDEMGFWFGGSSTFKMQHEETLSLPGPNEAQENSPIIYDGGNYNLYTRCQDANGNVNTANFVFKYCVDDGPKTTPPFIVGTDLLNGMPVAFNQTSVDIEVYVNEPAECKWSHLDQAYENMETQMVCENSVTDMNAQMVYKCLTTLSGLKNKIENKFYFRCKDQPLAEEKDRNVMAESYPFTLLGTEPLVIDFVGPNGTIKDATDSIQITLEAATSAGYKEGEASCYFGETEETNNEFLFGNSNSYEHSQDLWLFAGDYTYYIMCVDLGGNSDTAEITFTIESDSSSPRIIRAYREVNKLKLITSEAAECVYSKDSCSYSFADGIKMNVFEDINHFTEWETQDILYVKCQDKFGNQPYPDQCSMIAKPFDTE